MTTIKRKPMRHTYDAYSAEFKGEDGVMIEVNRDGILDTPFFVAFWSKTHRHSLWMTREQAQALATMLTEAVEAVKEEA